MHRIVSSETRWLVGKTLLDMVFAASLTVLSLFVSRRRSTSTHGQCRRYHETLAWRWLSVDQRALWNGMTGQLNIDIEHQRVHTTQRNSRIGDSRNEQSGKGGGGKMQDSGMGQGRKRMGETSNCWRKLRAALLAACVVTYRRSGTEHIVNIFIRDTIVGKNCRCFDVQLTNWHLRDFNFSSTLLRPTC